MEDKIHILTSRLKAHVDMPLSVFVQENLDVFHEIKTLKIPLRRQAYIASHKLGRPISVSSLAVAISRLKVSSKPKPPVIIMVKHTRERFVPKGAILTLGGQKTIKEGKTPTEVLIDWRGLNINESVSSWVSEYKNHLVAINMTGWRWSQIASAVNRHLDLKKPISTSTLTSIISLSNHSTT